MRALRANKAGRWLVAVLTALVLVLIMGASPALAADEPTVELTAAQKQKAHDELVPIIVAQVCESSLGGKVVSILPGGKVTCIAGVTGMLPETFESLQAFQASIEGGTFCKAVSTGIPSPGNVAVEIPCNLAFNDALSAGIKSAVNAWWEEFTKTIGAVVGFVEFIANPASGLDQMANSMKKDSVNALGTTLNALSLSTDFDAGDPVFRTVWASATGMGLVVLAVMVLLTLRSSAAGKIDGAEATKSLVVWAPIAVLMMVFGPVIGHVITGWLQPINEGLINWGTAPMNTAIIIMNGFAAVPSSPLFGPLLGIFLWGMLLVGSWATFFLMIVWKASLLLMGIGIGVALGMLVNPLWRSKVMKLVVTFGGIMASKTILLFMLGAGFFMMGIGKEVVPGTNPEITNIVNIFVSGLILIMVFLFPVLLLKYVPLTPEGSQSSRNGGSIAGAAVMAGSAAAMSMSISNNRRESIRNQNTSGGTTSTGAPWSRAQEPTRLVPGGGSGSGAQPQNGVYGAKSGQVSAGGSAAAKGEGAAAKGGGAAAKGGGAAAQGAVSTGVKPTSTAGAGASSGAGAAAGASTAGVAMAVQAGIAATNAAAAKTKEAAHSAAPEVPE